MWIVAWAGVSLHLHQNSLDLQYEDRFHSQDVMSQQILANRKKEREEKARKSEEERRARKAAKKKKVRRMKIHWEPLAADGDVFG